MRNELLHTVLDFLFVEPVRNRAASGGKHCPQPVLRGVPVAAFEGEVVEDDAVSDCAVPGWIARGRWAESWVRLAWGGRGEGEAEGSCEGDEELGGEHSRCQFVVWEESDGCLRSELGDEEEGNEVGVPVRMVRMMGAIDQKVELVGGAVITYACGLATSSLLSLRVIVVIL